MLNKGFTFNLKKLDKIPQCFKYGDAINHG